MWMKEDSEGRGLRLGLSWVSFGSCGLRAFLLFKWRHGNRGRPEQEAGMFRLLTLKLFSLVGYPGIPAAGGPVMRVIEHTVLPAALEHVRTCTVGTYYLDRYSVPMLPCPGVFGDDIRHNMDHLAEYTPHIPT